MELLIDLAVRQAAATGTDAPAMAFSSRDAVVPPDHAGMESEPARGGRRPAPRRPARRPRDDEADLQLVLSVLHAFARHEAVRGSPRGTRVLRETIYFPWEGPRLPPGGTCSPVLAHTAAAREQRDADDHTDLVQEHAVPIDIVLRALLAAPPNSTASLRRVLDATSPRVILTRAEDTQLSEAGFRHRTPDGHNSWARCGAVGMDPASFAPWRSAVEGRQD